MEFRQSTEGMIYLGSTTLGLLLERFKWPGVTWNRPKSSLFMCLHLDMMIERLCSARMVYWNRWPFQLVGPRALRYSILVKKVEVAWPL